MTRGLLSQTSKKKHFLVLVVRGGGGEVMEKIENVLGNSIRYRLYVLILN